MSLKTQIEDAARSALKNHEPELLSTLRMLLSAIHNKEIEKRAKTGKPEELPEEEATAVLRSEAKKRREATVEYEKAGRKESAEKETRELKILEKYLPQELGDEEIEKMARDVVVQIGPVGEKDFGRVMGEVMKKLKGQAGGDRVGGVVKKLLAP